MAPPWPRLSCTQVATSLDPGKEKGHAATGVAFLGWQMSLALGIEGIAEILECLGRTLQRRSGSFQDLNDFDRVGQLFR